MAAVAIEGAEVFAPELEALGSEALGEAEKLGSQLFNRFGRKGAQAAEREATTVGQDVLTRLSDVGTGVMLGQSIGSNTKQPVVQKEGGCDCQPYGDDSSDSDYFTGGAAATYVINPRPLSEKIQIAVLVVLALIVIVVTIVISVKNSGTQVGYWSGLTLGVISGATLFWIMRMRMKND
jgi:hypothetical protein